MNNSRTLRYVRMLVVLPAALSAVLWLAACSDKKDEDKPAELVDIKPQLNVERLWSHGLGGGGERLRLALRPAVEQGVVFAAGYGGKVEAFKADDGDKLWHIKTKLPLSAGPGVKGDVVVLGALDGTLLALDAKTGAERWRTALTSEVLADPVFVDDLVIIRTVDGKLTALTIAKGEQRWTTEQSVPRLSLRGTAHPIVSGDTIFTGFDNGRVVAVDAKTGDTVWDTVVSTPRGKNELERLVDIDGPVRVSGDDVYVAGFQGRMAMLAKDSGQIWWAQDFSTYRGFALEADAMYLSNADGSVVAVRRTDGSVIWRQSELARRALTAPAVDKKALVVGDYEGYLHWLSPNDGVIIARAKTDGERITNAPLVADGRVFVQTDDGKLIAFATQPKQGG